MKVCQNKKCGATDIAPDARYCPRCGERFPYAKDVRVIDNDYWKALKKKAQPSPGKTLVNKDEYNRVLNSYQNMINNGYASPLCDKEVIQDADLRQMRKNSTELSRWKRECESRRNTPIYDYEDEYSHDFYWGNALLVLAIIIPFVFFLVIFFVVIPNRKEDNSKREAVEIVLDEKTGKYGIMNHRIDSLVTPCIYDTIIHYAYIDHWNYYKLEKKGILNIANSSGVRTISEDLDSTRYVTGSDVVLLFKGERQGLMTQDGQPIFEPRYYRVLWIYEPYNVSFTNIESPGRFIGNILPVKASQNSDWELYNREGMKITNQQFRYVSQVRHPDLIKIANSYNKWGLINSKGKTILPCDYSYIYMFTEDMAWVSKGYSRSDTWSCISPEGEKLGVLSKGYKPISGFSSGLSPVSYGKAPYGSHIGYSNSKGEIVIPAKYGYYHTSSGAILWPSPSFTGDSALVSYQGKNGVLRKDGTFKEKE